MWQQVICFQHPRWHKLRSRSINFVFILFSVSFSTDVCRSMVAMLDTDHSGKLGLLELKTLLGSIFKWNTVFRSYDADKSGHLSSLELRDSLNAAGFKLNNRILTSLCHRYSNRDGTISFVDFITCAVKIKTMIGMKCYKISNIFLWFDLQFLLQIFLRIVMLTVKMKVNSQWKNGWPWRFLKCC